MRLAMVFNMAAVFMFIGNLLDLFQDHEDWSPSVPSIAISGFAIVLLSIYMIATPDRQVVALHRVKPLVSPEEYKKLKTKGR